MKLTEYKNIKFEIREVTPEEASTILEKHYARVLEGKFRQRPVTKSVVLRYTSDIVADNWMASPHGAAFDVNGDLIDGQHRFEACRKSGKPIILTISTGWPVGTNGKKLINIIDTGKTRTTAQMMHLDGMTSANAMCSILRAIATVAWAGQRPILTFASTSYLLKDMNMEESITRIGGRCQSNRDFLGRLVGPLAYYHTVRPAKALAFAEGLFQMEFTTGSAVQTFVKWRRIHERIHGDDHLKAFCGCIRAWDANEQITHVKLSREHTEWLSNMNPELRNKIRKMIPRTE